MLEVLRERGDLDDAERRWLDAGLADELPPSLSGTALTEARGRLRAAAGRLGEALDDLRGAGRRWEDVGVRNPSMTAWRSGAALVLLQTGDRKSAAQLAGDELEIARTVGRPRALGIAMRATALARRDERLLVEAVDVLRGEAPLELAKTLCELGAMRRRAGRRTEAREPLLQALELATRCGARPVSRRARSELAASGARPRRDAITGRDALTPGELRVAGMAASGNSNRNIAQALFLTLRTVETHLTSTYRKLGITSRTQLADALIATSARS